MIRKQLRDWFFARTQSFRKTRMQAFVREFQPTGAMQILDIGGTDLMWRITDQPARVVLLNTKMPEGGYDLGLLGTEYSDEQACGPGAGGPPGNVEYVLGDGKSVPYADGEFDICFSNSTIEHLSRLELQHRFANEVRRVARGVWLQTPARRFPFEPHWLSPYRRAGSDASGETSRSMGGCSAQVKRTWLTWSTSCGFSAFERCRNSSLIARSAASASSA